MGIDNALIAAQLDTRPSRSPDYKAESRALQLIAEELSADPKGVLQKCAELTVELCHATSADVSILECDGSQDTFR